MWKWGLFFFLFREGLVEFEVWVGSSSLVSDWGWLCVCVDDPIDKWFKHEPHANTHSSFRPHMRPSAQRYVR